MLLSKRKYNSFDLLRLPFQVSPACTTLGVLLSVLHAVLPTALTALATANFVDTAAEILSGARPRDDIYFPLFLLLVVLGLNITLGAVISMFRNRVQIQLRLKFKNEVVRIHAALDYKHIENVESEELIQRVSKDPVKSVMDGFDGYLTMVQIVISIVSILGLIVAQVWWAAVVIVVFSTPLLWLSMRAGKSIHKAFTDSSEQYRRTTYYDEVISGRDCVDERALFGYGKYVSKLWAEQYEIARRTQFKAMVKAFVFTKGAGLILAFVGFLIALTLIQPVLSGLLSAGMFMGIVSAVFSMITQLSWRMTGSGMSIARGNEYVKDLTAFCALDAAEGALAVPDAEPVDFRSLEFRDVRFKYPSGDVYILDGLSFSLESGCHYAFVGKNGAGKTTITKLLTGLYTDYEGEILINGRELRSYSAGALKALFSVVYQDFARYYVSLKDNITLGDVAGSPADEVAAEMAALSGLEEPLDTVLGKIKEGGKDISGGQWQRLAIARSLISRAKVKMLDEPTAALDPLSESRVYEEFEKLMAGKTTIFISHRLGSTKLADKILVIDEGRIAECGSHKELMAAGGQYKEMFESQRSWYQ